jgi:hypothetical protein
MPANYFPCYPFAHPFEEEVTHLLAASLDESFLLVHNVIRPNKRRRSLFPKEIDLTPPHLEFEVWEPYIIL